MPIPLMNMRVRRMAALAAIACSLACLTAAAQPARDSVRTTSGTGRTVPRIIVDDIGAGLHDALDFFTAPVRWEGRDWLTLAAVGGGTGLVMAADPAIRRRVGPGNGPVPGFLNDFGGDYGTGAYALAGGGAIWLAGLAAGDDGIRTTGRMTIEALALSGVVTSVIKTVAGRSRPFTGDGASRYRPWSFVNEHNSFPSGHTTVAFAVSTVLADRIDWVPATIVLYAAAAITGWQRIATDQHWASDVFAGAAIGFFSARFVTSRGADARDGAGVTILPCVPSTGSGGGVMMVVRW